MSNLRKVFLQKAALVAVISALAIPARAQSMQVYGKTGYLGEYELSRSGKSAIYGASIARHRCRKRHLNLSEPDLGMFLVTELVDAVICPTGADGLQFRLALTEHPP